MNRTLAFSGRNARELLRDPLTLAFGIGFPVVLITLISLMTRSIPEMSQSTFGIGSFAPGMAVFGLSFISLFLAMLIAGDRESAFLMRIFASPMTAAEYIAGYALPLLPVALLQGAVCFAWAAVFGLKLTAGIAAALLTLLPVSLLYISLGILLGCVLTYRQVGGVASIIINLSAWLSGTWFDPDLIGGAFRGICRALPFYHAVGAVKAAAAQNWGEIWPHLAVVLLYAAAAGAAGVILFRRRMQGRQ